MTKTTMFAGPFGEIAVHESKGWDSRSFSSTAIPAPRAPFRARLEGPLGASHRLVAIDLMGHGRSANAGDPAALSVVRPCALARCLADRVAGSKDSILVGWSLGGHILLEAAPDLARGARPSMIFGTPPIGFPPAMDKAFLPNPAMQAGFMPEITSRQWPRPMSPRSSHRDLPTFPIFPSRTCCEPTGLARAQVGASIDPAVTRDEVEVAAALKIPLAVLHGAQEQLVNGAYFGPLKLPTLWRGATQVVADAGHTAAMGARENSTRCCALSQPICGT